MSLIFALLGGALYRWRGHASKYKKYFPRPFNQIAFALPHAAVCWPVIGWWSALVLIFTTLGVLTGHGRGMSLGILKLIGDPEKIEILIKWLIPHIPVYWYKVLILALTGLAVTLPAGIVLGSPILALSGALKALAYMIGWKWCYRHTEAGEFLTGVFLWGTLGFYIL